MQALEKVIYVCAAITTMIIYKNSDFTKAFITLIGDISSSLVIIGIIYAAISLIWRRIRIRTGRGTYGAKAEQVVPSVRITLIDVAKLFGFIWIILAFVGTMELLTQHL